jgi:uncharacterized membrane protein
MSRLVPWLTPLLALAGIGVSSYLTWVHYDVDALVCGIGDCLEVQTSDYAEAFGIPVAILGLLMYVGILVLAVLRIARPALSGMLTAALFTGTLAGLIYSAWLTYVEIWVLEAICQWCVVSAIITLAIVAIEATTLWRGEPEELA